MMATCFWFSLCVVLGFVFEFLDCCLCGVIVLFSIDSGVGMYSTFVFPHLFFFVLSIWGAKKRKALRRRGELWDAARFLHLSVARDTMFPMQDSARFSVIVVPKRRYWWLGGPSLHCLQVPVSAESSGSYLCSCSCLSAHLISQTNCSVIATLSSNSRSSRSSNCSE